MKRKIVLIISTFFIVFSLFKIYFFIKIQFEIDKCLDKGIRWNYQKDECE